MTYAPPPGRPEPPYQHGQPYQPGYPPPPQPQKSKTGLIVGVILGILLLVCVVCGGIFAYFTWWANEAIEDAEDYVNNLPTDFPFPTDFPTPDGETMLRITLP